jgi:hypothetical protein
LEEERLFCDVAITRAEKKQATLMPPPAPVGNLRSAESPGFLMRLHPVRQLWFAVVRRAKRTVSSIAV